MTASARDVRLLQTARRILEEAGRPLNVRRILRAGEQDARFEGEPTLEELRAALISEAADGVVSESRPGIFVLAGAGERGAPAAEAKVARRPARAAAPEAAAEDDEDGGKRRRRRRGRDSRADGPAETPISLDEAADLSESAPDRESLKGKLWERLRRKAAQVTDQPTPAGQAPRAPRDQSAQADASTPSPQETEEGARHRRRRRDGAERSAADPAAAADEKPRRRRRRGPAGDDAPEQPSPSAAPAEARPSSGDDPRARLKARLAGRSRASEDSAEPAPRASAPRAPVSPPAPAPTDSAASDPRARLKNRIAARLADDEPDGRETSRRRRRGGQAQEPAPARPAAAASDSTDPKAALRARLASRMARAPEAQAPAMSDAAPAPAPAAPKRQSSASDPRARLKARLAARQGDSTPAAAPAAAERPAASREAGRTPRSALKARMAARAGAEPTPAPAAPSAAVAAPAARAPGGDARAAMKARLAARRGSETPATAAPVEVATPAKTPAAAGRSTARAPAQDARAALKARLAARQGSEGQGAERPEPAQAPTPAADPLAVPLADSRRPYREKRAAQVEPSTERRAPALAEVSSTSTLVSAALAALRGHGSPMTIEALAKEVDATAEGGAGGLRAALLAENGRRDRVGLRPSFVAHYGGAVGLTEWGLSARYRALENQVQEALAEQRELVRRDLLARIGDLTDLGFEQVVVMLLEQLGHLRVGVVHRQAGTVALTVTRATDGGGTEKIAVVARRSWGPIKDGTVRRIRDTLAHFEADSGLIITVGTFAGSARAEARQEGQAHVRLIDGAGLAGLLFDHGIGLAHHQPMMRYLDVAFFESLEA